VVIFRQYRWLATDACSGGCAFLRQHSAVVIFSMPLERAVSLMACATKTLHFHVLARNVINDRVVGFLELDRIAAVSDDRPIEFHLDADAAGFVSMRCPGCFLYPGPLFAFTDFSCLICRPL
jgi:hypothetical protein